MPWLYELGMEAYRASKAGLSDEAARAMRQFRRAIEVMRHGPLMEEMGMDPKLLHMLIRELEHSTMLQPSPDEEQSAKPSPKKGEKDNA